jgi:hypothetical protein
MHPGRVLAIGLATLTATGAVACSSTRVPGGGGPTRSERAEVGTTGGGPESVGCASAVSSPGQTWPDRWPRPVDQAVVAGPIAWPDALDLASDPGARSTAAAYAPYHGLSLIVDDLVAVDPGERAAPALAGLPRPLAPHGRRPVLRRRRRERDHLPLMPAGIDRRAVVALRRRLHRRRGAVRASRRVRRPEQPAARAPDPVRSARRCLPIRPALTMSLGPRDGRKATRYLWTIREGDRVVRTIGL